MEDAETVKNADDEQAPEAEDPRETATASEDASEDESLDELIAKKTQDEGEAQDEGEPESVLEAQRDEPVTGTLPSNVKPKQSSEFTCRNCFLVKHHSQLANKRRMLCKDCA